MLSGYRSEDMRELDALDRVSYCTVPDNQRELRYVSELRMVQAKVMTYYSEKALESGRGSAQYYEFTFDTDGGISFIGWCLDVF